MSEPRTRTAAEVADHASAVVDDAQRTETVWLTGSGSHRTAALPEALRLIQRLAAQVEDLAAEVDRLQHHVVDAEARAQRLRRA